LPISKKLVEMHQGHLGVESVYDQGTTFIVRLPKSNHVEAGAESASGGRTLPLVRVESPERIVVVAHNDPTVAPTLDRYFSNYHVIGAESVAAALKLADEVKAIAVVADQFSLAGASSTRITEAELANDCLLVNCPLPSGRRVAEALGTADFLMKPVSRRSLLAALDRLKRPIRRLLVVDDNPEVVALFERMLSQHPTLESCRHAFNGEEALDLMRAETPDAVILDLIRPDLDGHAVLDQIAADPHLVKVPVIVVSAETHNALYVTTGNPIRIAKMGEFQIGEVVRTLEGTFNALTTGWHPPAATVSGVGARPDASPVSVGRLLPPTSAPVEAR
jgi:CheY-like chemotaxis protein